MFRHSIQNNQELTHTGGKRHLWSFSSFPKTFVKCLDNRVTADSCHNSHVKHCTQMTPASPYRAFTFHRPTVSVKRSNTNQRSNLFTIKTPKLWQLCKQSSSQYRSYTRNTTQQILPLSPNRTGTKQIPEVFVQVLQTLSQIGNMLLDTTGNWHRNLSQTVLFHRKHLNYLLTPSHHSTQSLSAVVRQRSDFRPYCFTKTSQYLCINRVCLGKCPCSTGKIPYLTRINNYYRNTHISQHTGHSTLKASAGFKDNQSRIPALNLLSKGDKGFIFLFKTITLACRMYINIQLSLRNINTDPRFTLSFHNLISYYPALQDTSSLIEALATVRVNWVMNVNDPCSPTVFFTQGQDGLSRSRQL